MDALKVAIDLVGSQAELARKLGVSPMTVTQWKRRGVPVRRVKEIEAATDFRVSRHDLCEEVYPREPWCRCPACVRQREEVPA